jgi:Spy/CpxP family protein refolding chaperone
MRTINRLILLTGFGLVSLLAMASSNDHTDNQRGNRNPEKIAQKQTERLHQIVHLNDEQYKQILNISLESAQRISDLRKNATLEGEQKKQAFRMERMKRKDEIICLLSPEQRNLFRQHQLNNRKEKQGKE